MGTHEQKSDDKKVSTKDRTQTINPEKTEEEGADDIGTKDRTQTIKPSN
ncbi:hypothetical protein [Streptomyces sp. NPDC048172]